MSELRISLFGSVRVSDGRGSPVRVSRAATGLLAYLMLHRERAHSREVLADLFWPGSREDRARNCLNTALWRLRRTLEPDDEDRGSFLLTSAGEVGFNPEGDYWLDVEEFETTVRKLLATPVRSMRPADAKKLEAALKLQAGELMEGYFDDWTIRERDRLREQLIQGLQHLMEYHEHGRDLDRAISFGQRLLHHDPLREEIHREVMRLYAQSGQRTLALRHYEACCQLLDDELGVGPEEETRALHARVLRLADGDSRSPPVRAGSPRSDAARLEGAFAELRVALRECDKLHQRLHHLHDLFSRLRSQELETPIE